MTDPSAPPEPRVSRHIARQGKRVISGCFDASVSKALKLLALEQDITVQILVARAINDLLEKHGRGRLASEEPLPRGGAAQLAYAQALGAAAASPAPEPAPRPRSRRPS